jgi:hypothetical protein
VGLYKRIKEEKRRRLPLGCCAGFSKFYLYEIKGDASLLEERELKENEKAGSFFFFFEWWEGLISILFLFQ